MSTSHRIVNLDEIEPVTRRGGNVHTLLSPTTVGSSSGFLGVAIIPPGDRISEHYHPYSEEFLYVVSGPILAELDDAPHLLPTGSAVLIPIGVRHRLSNQGPDEASVVFHLGPLAPRPDLGHVDTETTAVTPADQGSG